MSKYILFDTFKIHNSSGETYVDRKINDSFEIIKVVSKLLEYSMKISHTYNKNYISLNWNFEINNQRLFTLNFYFSPNKSDKYFLKKIAIFNLKKQESYKYYNTNEFLTALDNFIELL